MTIRTPSILLVLSSAFLCLAPIIGLAQDHSARVATINAEFVIGKSKDGRRLQIRLQELENTLQAQMAELEAQIQQMRNRLNNDADLMSEGNLQLLQQSYEKKTLELRRYQDDSQRQYNELQRAGLLELEQKIRAVTRMVALEHGYDLVLNDTSGVVVFNSGDHDLSPMVIARMNHEH